MKSENMEEFLIRNDKKFISMGGISCTIFSMHELYIVIDKALQALNFYAIITTLNKQIIEC